MPLKHNLVEAKRLLMGRKTVSSADHPSQSSEGAITYNLVELKNLPVHPLAR